MRVLMISDVYFPRVNGVSTSMQTFRNELEGLGHEVSLIVPEYGTADEGHSKHLLRVPSRRVLFDPEDRMMKSAGVLGTSEALRARDFDIVHVQTPFVAHHTGVKIAKRLNLPRVETYHTFFEEYLYNYIPFLPRSWMRALARRFSRSQCNNVDAVIVPSTPMLETLRDYGVTTEMAVIPTGIPSDGFRRGDGARFRQAYGIPSTCPVLVYVGRVAHEKNIEFLLRVIALVRRQIPDVLLIIAGEGPATGSLKERVAKMGLEEHVMFVGYLSRDGRLQDCYCAGDAFVFASRTETQGLVLLEAMALGVPVISTAVMGTRDILCRGRGCVVAEEDTGDFADKTVAVLRDRTLRHRLSCEAREYAGTWSASTLAGKMAELYERMISDHPCRKQEFVRSDS